MVVCCFSIVSYRSSVLIRAAATLLAVEAAASWHAVDRDAVAGSFFPFFLLLLLLIGLDTDISMTHPLIDVMH